MWGMIIAAGIAAVSAVVGKLIEAGEQAKAEELMKQAAAQYDMPLPDLKQVVAKTLTGTAFDDVQTDSRLSNAQYGALDKLKQVGDAQGLTLQDRVALNEARNDAARAATSRQASILDDMHSRGVGGSGAELAMSLQNAQNEAQTNSDASMHAAADAQQRALDAIISRGRMAGDIRSQEFEEQSRKAEARDAIDRYNADAINRARYYNANLGQQRWEDDLALRTNRANAIMGQAGYQAARAQTAGDAVASGGRGVAQGVAAYGMYHDDDDDNRRQSGGY